MWGATGSMVMVYRIEENILDKDFEKQDKQEAEFKKADERMKYGKGWLQTFKSLRRGEVKKFNKLTGKWEKQ